MKASTAETSRRAEEEGIIERCFRGLGKSISKYWFVVLPIIFAIYIPLALGIFDGAVETRFFNYLCLKPRSRLQRETNYYSNRVDEGYVGGTEIISGVATKRGKNVLNRYNLQQTANFFAAQGNPDLAISYSGTTITGNDVLIVQPPAPQPSRVTLMDCYQEGSYDFDGDIVTLNPSAETPLAVMKYMMEPFYLADLGQSFPLDVTPYNYCIFARISVLFAAIPDADPTLFGRCRQFINDEISDTDAYRAVEKAYEFYRFFMYDLTLSSASLNLVWGCRRPFNDPDEAPGRCDSAFSCCDLSQVNAICALCELEGDEACGQYEIPNFGQPASRETCNFLADLISDQSSNSTSTDSAWRPNDEYDMSYAALPACTDAFDFYPVSEPFATVLSGAMGIPTDAARPQVLGFDSCPERYAAFLAAEANDADTVTEIVQQGTESIICDFQGTGDYTCSSKATTADYDWRFEKLVGTDEELIATGLSGTCAQWDGGPDGLAIFPYIEILSILGEIDYERNYAGIQTHLYLSRGYKGMCDLLRAKGYDIGTNECKHAREEWLLKFADQNHGRDDEGPMLFSCLSSVSTDRSWKDQTSPERTILLIGYALIFFYAAASAFAKAPKGSSFCERCGFMLLSIIGVILVFVGLAGGWGLSAGYLNIRLNTASIQVLPFLLVGIGVNDQFVMASAYNRMLELASNDATVVDIMGDLLAEVGPSVTLTSVANICAFLVALRMKIRLIRDFATTASLSVAAIFFCLLFAFSAVLSIHCSLRKKRQFEPTATIKEEEETEYASADTLTAVSAKEIEADFTDSQEKNVSSAPVTSFDSAIDTYSRILTKPIVSISIILITLVVLAVLCPIYLPDLRRKGGLPIEQLFAPGSSASDFGKSIDRVKRAPGRFQHKAFDFAHLHPYYAPLNRGDYSLLQTFADAKKTEAFVLTWYHIFVQWANPCAYSSFVNGDPSSFSAEDCAASFYQTALSYNPRCVPTDPFSGGNCGPKVTAEKVFSVDEHELAATKAAIAQPLGLANSGIPVCTVWPVYMFKCEDGTRQCFADHLHEEDLDPARDPALLGFHPDYFYECLDLWINSDETWALLTPLFLCHDPEEFTSITLCDSLAPGERRMWRGADGEGDMEFSAVRVFLEGIATTAPPWETYLESALPKLRDFEKDTGIYGFQGSEDEKFFTQYRYLMFRLWMTILLAVLVIFGIIGLAFFSYMPRNMSLFKKILASILTTSTICFNIMVAILLTCCTFAATNFRINCFSAVNLIMAVGFAVDFLTHLALMYARLPINDNRSRLCEAMRLMLPPIIDGSISTLCSIIPLSASRYPYIVHYFFGLYAMISCFGIFVGVCLLPACLATFGAFKFVSTEDQDNLPIVNASLVSSNGDESTIDETKADISAD